MTDEYFLRNRGTHAVVTGGGQGLGLAVAQRLAREGAPTIVLASRGVTKGEAAAKEVRALGAECIFVETDVAKPDDCFRLIDHAVATFGIVNGLVNAAANPDRGTLVDTGLDLWDAHFDTNARGPCLLIQATVRRLIDRGEPGSIVNVLSMAAHCGQSYLAPYSASKAALANLTKNVANAYARDRSLRRLRMRDGAGNSGPTMQSITENYFFFVDLGASPTFVVMPTPIACKEARPSLA